MFTHPVAIGGYVLTAIGWFMLLNGGATDVGFRNAPIVNFHTLWIGSASILTGGLMVVAGVLAQGLQRLEARLVGTKRTDPSTKDARAAKQPKPKATNDASVSEEDYLRTEMNRKLNEIGLRT